VADIGKDNLGSDLELPPLPEGLSAKQEEKKGFFGSFFRKKASGKEQPKELPPETFAPLEEMPSEKPPEKKKSEFTCSICNAEFKNAKALKLHTKQAHPGGIKYCLILKTGDKIKDFDDLVHYIKYMDDDTFAYHTSKTNEFANWVENALENRELAAKLRTAKTKVDAIRVLYGKDVRNEEEIRKSEEEAKAQKAVEEEIDLRPVEDYEKYMPKEELLPKKAEEKPKGLFGIFRKSAEKKKVPEPANQEKVSEQTEMEKQLQESMRIVGPLPPGKEEPFPKEKAELEILNEELEEKSQEISESVQELLKNRSYVKARSKELSEKLREIVAGQKKIEKSRKMLEDKLKLLQRMQADIKDRERRIADSRKELAEQERVIALRKKEIENFKINSNDLKELKKELPKLRKEYSETARKLEKTDAKLQKINEQYEKKGPGLEKAKQEIREREIAVAQKEAELESRKAQLMDIQYRLLEEKNRLEEERFELYVKHELKKEMPTEPPSTSVNVPGFIKQESPITHPEFDSALREASALAEAGRIEEASSIACQLEMENSNPRISEQEKRERAYRIMELKTDIRLASVKRRAY